MAQGKNPRLLVLGMEIGTGRIQNLARRSLAQAEAGRITIYN